MLSCRTAGRRTPQHLEVTLENASQGLRDEPGADGTAIRDPKGLK